MPKASRSNPARTGQEARAKPYDKTTQDQESQLSSSRRHKDPKQSHLYTDDNPSTTLHGTGFKDGAAADRTISLVSRRSLTYQWQVINTMHYRAKGHPAMKKGTGSEGMQSAMEIFRHWLDETYPDAKEKRRREGREFKPLLKKETVKKYLKRILDLRLVQGEPSSHPRDDSQADYVHFAKMYSELPKGKRLANLLLDNAHPEAEDWEIRREHALVCLNRIKAGEGEEGLWNEKGGVSDWHLNCIAWAWSPVGERRLPP